MQRPDHRVDEVWKHLLPEIRSLGGCARVAGRLLQWLEDSPPPNGKSYSGLPSYLARIKTTVERASGPADLHRTMDSIMLAIDRGGADPSSPDLPEEWVVRFDELVQWISCYRGGRVQVGQALPRETTLHPFSFTAMRRQRLASSSS